MQWIPHVRSAFPEPDQVFVIWAFCLSRSRCLSYFNILQLFCFPSAFLAHKYHKWRISWFLVVANRGWTICASLRCETLAASQTRCSCPIHHCKAGQNLGSDYSFLEPTWTNCSAVISFLQISTGSIVFNTKLRSRVRCWGHRLSFADFDPDENPSANHTGSVSRGRFGWQYEYESTFSNFASNCFVERVWEFETLSSEWVAQDTRC